MKEIPFTPDEGENVLYRTRRRPEWGMALPCLFSVLMLLVFLWRSKLLVWIIGTLIALALLFYAIRLIICAYHDWVVLTDRRIVLCTYSIPFFREIIKTCMLSEVESYRQFQGLYSSRRKRNKGELEITLHNGKHFWLPTLIGMDGFLEAFSKVYGHSQTEIEVNTDEKTGNDR